MFSLEEAEKEINRALMKNLGKIGLAKYDFQVVKVLSFDREIEVYLDGISANEFCVFWSTLAFGSRVKIELKEASFSDFPTI